MDTVVRPAEYMGDRCLEPSVKDVGNTLISENMRRGNIVETVNETYIL